MNNRREFFRQLMASGVAGMMAEAQAAIPRALEIDPEPGSTFYDAEHVVILMQENRSFDHTFGTLNGVRGFNDPRAIRLPDGNPVWIQANEKGERYVPFRLDLKETKSTWMDCLPHSWADQVDARNHGKYNRWLEIKKSQIKAYADMPLTLGYYSRKDLPFYYSLADAFTICDQHFCSTLTGTTPNRLHLWTGTIRPQQSAAAPPNVLNSDVDLKRFANWTTFPERLEDHGISWKVYQNELTVESGLSHDEDEWLANFGDNPLEYFTQYHVRHSVNHRRYVEKRLAELPGELQTLREQAAKKSGEELAKDRKRIAELTAKLDAFEKEKNEFTPESFAKLSQRLKDLHAKAFDCNQGDPDYRQLQEIKYRDGEQERQMKVPKGDVLFQFRKDVSEGKLPTVSWLVSPEKFSDHPTSPWYGAWYISEAMNILTSNPDVWKKTIFILTYDENDGYFDHVPPFTAPHPSRAETGKVTTGIDAGLEFVVLAQDMKSKPKSQARESALGLGYRVPMIIASPWTRGGCVCSQVFDHTSPLQFLEKFLSRKFGKRVQEPNINQWRRTVCGDLTSAFQSPGNAKKMGLPFHDRNKFVESIERSKSKPLPTGYRPLTSVEVEAIRRKPAGSPMLPRQEAGQRRSAPLPYQLTVDGWVDAKVKQFLIRMAARKDRFGELSSGAPFIAYVFQSSGDFTVRNYAVGKSGTLDDSFDLRTTPEHYHLRIDGPNGFCREFKGDINDPVKVLVEDIWSSKDAKALVEIQLVNSGSSPFTIEIIDRSYNLGRQTKNIAPGSQSSVIVDTKSSFGWYDFSVTVVGRPNFEKRYSGRVETGRWSFTDPAIS